MKLHTSVLKFPVNTSLSVPNVFHSILLMSTPQPVFYCQYERPIFTPI